MKYNYKDKELVLDDSLVREYEKLSGSTFSDTDIEYLIKHDKLSDNNLSTAIERQIKEELAVLS